MLFYKKNYAKFELWGPSEENLYVKKFLWEVSWLSPRFLTASFLQKKYVCDSAYIFLKFLSSHILILKTHVGVPTLEFYNKSSHTKILSSVFI